MNIRVGPASDFDGYCNACEPSPSGSMPVRRVLLIRINSMSFRLCHEHAEELVFDLERYLPIKVRSKL